MAEGDLEENTAFAVNEVNRIHRVQKRGRYDRPSVYAILDAALICHIAYVIDGQPYCTPTGFGGRATIFIGMARQPAG